MTSAGIHSTIVIAIHARDTTAAIATERAIDDTTHDRDPRRDGRWRGVSGVSRRDFGGRHGRPVNGDERWRRRVAEAEPLPDVPVRPAGHTNRPLAEGDGERPRRWTIARRGGCSRRVIT